MTFDPDRIVYAVSGVRGIRAVALGGSRSRDEASPDSDADIGLYYDADSLDVPALSRCLTELDDARREGLLNPPGAWGPWIDGGGWLTVGGMPTDLLLRGVARVESTVLDCVAGRITIDWQSGHPFGFVNAVYAAETHYCRPLWQDPSRPLDRLKALLASEGPYPPRMRAAITERFLWEAGFSLSCGRKAAVRDDVNYAMGSAFRTVCAWTQVLFALNGRYQMNEKGSLAAADRMPTAPVRLEARVGEACREIAAGRGGTAWRILEDLHAEIGILAAP